MFNNGFVAGQLAVCPCCKESKIMKTQLMINDIVCDNEGRTGRVIELDEENFIIRADGEEYHGESTKPVLLTEEWEKKATEICKPYNISLDWTRTHRLKLSVLNEKPSLGIKTKDLV